MERRDSLQAGLLMPLDVGRLKQVSNGMLLVVLVCAAVAAHSALASTVLVLLLVAVCLLGARRLLAKNQVNLAAGIILLTIAGFACWQLVTANGMHDEMVIAFPAIFIFASMLSTRRLYWTLVLGMLLVLIAIGIANLSGWYVWPTPQRGHFSLVSIIAIVGTSAWFVWLLARDLRTALIRLKEENQRIHESLAKIDHLAHHDALTQLPNRLLARLRFEQVASLAKRHGNMAALVYIDLDNFKAVNDSLGHAGGDALLCEVAKRLSASVRAADTVSRQGGDEFLVIISDLASEAAVIGAANKIVDALAAPFEINGVDVSASGSVGVALYPRDGEEFDVLMKKADTAMYRVKEAGRNGFRMFSGEMKAGMEELLALISGMRQALINQEFQLYYQPQMDLASGRIIGAEALLRWVHSTLGPIPPTRFIRVAEQSGLMNELGTWVLTRACQQSMAWKQAGLPPLTIAINISPIQFHNERIEEIILQAMDGAHLSPEWVELELTESLLMEEKTELPAMLARLKALGVHFSIDDFGTGYSNLGYLKRFCVERLKIDKSFILRMKDDSDDENIVRTVIDMAHSLKLKVVAEGVEDAATLQRLRELGCDFGQGFYWSRALPADEFLRFVQTHHASLATDT